MFLCLFAGGTSQQLPKGLGTEETSHNKSQIAFSDWFQLFYHFRMFLCLFAGGTSQQLPKGLGTEETSHNKSQIAFSDKRYA